MMSSRGALCLEGSFVASFGLIGWKRQLKLRISLLEFACDSTQIPASIVIYSDFLVIQFVILVLEALLSDVFKHQLELIFCLGLSLRVRRCFRMV